MSSEGANDGMGSKDDPNVIRLRVENVKELGSEGVESERKIIDGFPWKLSIRRWDRGDGDGIMVFADCKMHEEFNIWECEVEGEVKLINHADESHSIRKERKSIICYFLNNSVSLGHYKLEEFMEDESFLVDGGIVIEAKIVVTWGNGVRFRKRLQTDFFSPSKYSDAILIVEGKKLHVSKHILALASPYFDVLFFGNFPKCSENEYVIPDVTVEVFLIILKLIYDGGRRGEGMPLFFFKNPLLGSILKAADQYQFTTVMMFAEDDLGWTMCCTSLSQHFEYLLLSDQYRFYELRASIMSHWSPFSSTGVTIDKIENFDSYCLFSNELKNQINECITAIGESGKVKNMIDSLRKRNVDRIEKMRTPIPSFNSPSNFSDVVLVVGEEKIYASKQILAHASSYFENLFFGDQGNCNENEFVIEDVSYKEFLVALEMIYDTFRKVDDENVEFLLKIAERFEITTISDKAEEYLICEYCAAFHIRLRLADQFKLEVSLKDSIDLIDSCSDIVELKKSESYKYYSLELKSALLDKMVELYEKE